MVFYFFPRTYINVFFLFFSLPVEDRAESESGNQVGSSSNDHVPNDDEMSGVKQNSNFQERNSGVSVICKSSIDEQDSKKAVDDVAQDMEVENNAPAKIEESATLDSSVKEENCENVIKVEENCIIKKENSDDVSNGESKNVLSVENKSTIQGKLLKDELMDIDTMKAEDEQSDSITTSEISDEQNREGKVDCINQDSLLKKLGFSAVKQLALGKNENIDVSNYEGSISNKLVLKSQENVLDKILDTESNGYSRSNSPGPLCNGESESHRIKRLCEQKSLIDNLKEDLRTEEAKLLLLRKVFDSQSNRKNGSLPLHKMKENSSRHMNLPSLHPKTRIPGQSYNSSLSEGNSSIQIAPKVVVGAKGSASGSNLPRIVPSIVPSTASSSNTDSPRGTYTPIHGSGSSGSSQGVHHKYYIQVGNQLVPAAPPTCINQPVYAMPSYSSASSVSAKGTSSVNTTGTAPSVKAKISAESQASKHSAAKAALRRQLEQTLLQIPPPRPPSADWRVIPNVNSMDFMMLVGLDEIVDMILENDGKPTLKNVLTETLPTNPLICDQCGMDFSPNWKQKEGEKAGEVLCEKCSLTNTKKELKAEHTSRLKSAFLKALKQEQELEEKIKAGEDVSISSPPLEKEHPPAPVAHHQPMHSVHKTYKHQKGPISSDHHHPPVHHHHHQVVQHYPHHTSLVHQLHQQHIQQQQVDYDGPVGGSHRSARWHPYIPSHHHSSSHVHSVPHHRSYSASSRGSDSRHEYYVVHHPQHSSSSGRWGH